MKQYPILFLLLLILSPSVAYAQFGASGVYKDESPAAGTGLDKILIFKNLSGATITYTAPASNTIRFGQYTNNQNDATTLPATDIGVSTSGGISTYTISNLQDNKGYFVDDNMQRKGIWVIDYSLHMPQLNSVSVETPIDPCSESLKLLINKRDTLTYNGLISGAKGAIKRLYTISYGDLVWKDNRFVEETVTIENKEIGDNWIISTPLMDTYFTLLGDQYATYFNQEQSVTSSLYQTSIVRGYIISPDSISEVQQAPLSLTFLGYSNEPIAKYHTWTIANIKDVNNPFIRYTDRDLEYEFTESGTYRVVLEVATDRSSCISRDSVNLTISESYLDIPNYFSPGDSPGYNDIFKVKYKSLTRFKCTIFNRWGTKIYEWTDPEQGWDGKYKGSYVSTGVYFYVIDAEGSDGIRYKKGGDINILR